ncbi:hypothetical protein [Paractinoplanes durhamensis]|uniref:hypothetical protein n=1 Tax=Paractinoplanes durhamensis TaxID=113563 RepID=UPI00362539C5
MTVLTRSAGFVGAVFAPQVHVTYAVLWTAAYEALVAGHDWRPTGGTALRAATVLAMLLYLRLIDERKDESYDRVHHPDRPLVTGLVTAAELSRAGRIVMAVVLVANAFYSPWSAVVAAAFFGYAAMLTPLERRFPRLRDDPLVNIAVVYPVQLLIGVFLAVSAGSPPYGRCWSSPLPFCILNSLVKRRGRRPRGCIPPPPSGRSAAPSRPSGSPSPPADLRAAGGRTPSWSFRSRPWPHSSAGACPHGRNPPRCCF